MTAQNLNETEMIRNEVHKCDFTGCRPETCGRPAAAGWRSLEKPSAWTLTAGPSGVFKNPFPEPWNPGCISHCGGQGSWKSLISKLVPVMSATLNLNAQNPAMPPHAALLVSSIPAFQQIDPAFRLFGQRFGRMLQECKCGKSEPLMFFTLQLDYPVVAAAIFVSGVGGTFQYGFSISVMTSPSEVSPPKPF